MHNSGTILRAMFENQADAISGGCNLVAFLDRPSVGRRDTVSWMPIMLRRPACFQSPPPKVAFEGLAKDVFEQLWLQTLHSEYHPLYPPYCRFWT